MSGSALIDIVLVAPQIGSNTGAVVRLCANAGARLHLVEPFGFALDEASVRRGGLDYHELTSVQRWESFAACRAGLGVQRPWFATMARAAQVYSEVTFGSDAVLVFGCESDGLPADVVAQFAASQRLRIPMRPENRSLNLANAVAVVLYEAWRQHGFEGAVTEVGAQTQERFEPLD